MVTRSEERRLYDELLERYGREIADAFMAAVADLRAGADLQRMIAAIAIGDMEAAIAAMHLDAAAYSALLESVRAAYVTSGSMAAGFITEAAAVTAIIRFDTRNVRAERWLANHSSSLVTRIVEDQRQAVRGALTAGMVRGENPRTTALDIVGRIDRASGKRDGGILGLTQRQQAAVEAARAELRSGDPAKLKNYLERKRRDKRFDKTVKRAIAEGKAVPAETVGKAVRQYKNRLLELRGTTIGRTESLTALRAARYEANLQAVERGDVKESAIRRTWRDAGDLRVRHTHSTLDGQSVGLREAFVSSSGARMLYPGDTSLGAPASEIIGCRCDVDYRIDHLANIR